MRRRTWALVRMCDVVFSHQVSLPSMIHDSDCDTELPHNIFDEEFGPETRVLPASRPITEPTPMAYMIAKVKLCIEQGNILQSTNRVGRQVPYDEILRFDSRLRDIVRELPPHLKMVPLEGSHDPVTLILARFNINILYHKIMCQLHRKYLPRARINPRYAHSRRSAIEGALETLQHLATLYRESGTSGRLRSIRWHVNSIATKDFMLPAMIVVLDLHYDNQANRSEERRNSEAAFFWTTEQRREMIECLETTRDIWSSLANTSMEAYKASKVLEIMLVKIKSPAGAAAGDGLVDGVDEARPADVFAGFNAAEMRLEHTAAMTLGLLSGSMSPDQGSGFGSLGSGITGTTPLPFSSMDISLATGALPPLGTDFGGDFGINNPQSPFSSMFNLGGAGADLSNFDWVSS
jgi:hypothetical protein